MAGLKEAESSKFQKPLSKKGALHTSTEQVSCPRFLLEQILEELQGNSGRKAEMHFFLTKRLNNMTEKMLLKEKMRI